MNKVLLEDVQEFATTFAMAEELHHSKFLITGATGLIGSTMIHCLMALKQEIKIVAPVRNIEKAIKKLGNYDGLTFIECNLETYDYIQINPVDYIIHCAAPTSSKFFVDHPVETYHSICNISDRILDYARQMGIKSMVYLSSLEVYGQILDDSNSVTEDIQGYLDPMDVRSSYPMAKRAVENLCCLYSRQYNVPVKVARLTQTTGAGCDSDDNRVIVQFAKLAAKGKDIILRTTGEAARPYCYTTDAISAILYILLKGKNGEAYNVANDETYISARDLAFFVKDHINPSISVKFDLKDNYGYAPVTRQKLSTKKLSDIGWNAKIKLDDILYKILRFYNNI